MLKVKTYLDRSAVHGIGLFAGEAIGVGREVWAFHPLVDLVIEPDRWQQMARQVAPRSFNQIRQLAYKEGGVIYLCLDNAQFMNHSISSQNIVNRRQANSMVALGDIAEGEELLCNYFEFCDEDDWSLPWLQG